MTIIIFMICNNKKTRFEKKLHETQSYCQAWPVEITLAIVLALNTALFITVFSRVLHCIFVSYVL